jgi:hypothetical protein
MAEYKPLPQGALAGNANTSETSFDPSAGRFSEQVEAPVQPKNYQPLPTNDSPQQTQTPQAQMDKVGGYIPKQTNYEREQEEADSETYRRKTREVKTYKERPISTEGQSGEYRKAIEQYNHSLSNRSYGQKYIQKPIGNAVYKLGHQAVSSVTSERDEDMAGAENAIDNIRVVGIATGNFIDKGNLKREQKKWGGMDAYTQAGNLFTKKQVGDGIFREDATVGGHEIVDPERVTRGDLAMFETKIKHPEKSTEELLNLRDRINNSRADGGVIDYAKLGKRNGLRKRVDRLVDASEINAFERLGQTLDRENPQMFTPSEKAILHREDKMLKAHSIDELNANNTLIKKILSEPSLTGEFAGLDPKSLMTERDYDKLIAGKIRGIKLDKNKKMDKNQMATGRAGAKAISANAKSLRYQQEMRKKMAERGSVGGFLLGKIGQEMQKDEDFANSSNVLGKSKMLAQKSASVVGHGVNLAGTATYKGVLRTGKVTAWAMDKTGHTAEAEAVRMINSKIIKGNKKLTNTFDTIKNAPQNAGKQIGKTITQAGKAVGVWTGRGLAYAGNRFASTKIGGALVKSPVGQGIKIGAGYARKGLGYAGKGLKIAGNAVMTPVRGIAKVMDVAKKHIIRPLICIVGGYLILISLITAIFGGSGGSSAIVVAILDDPVHFTNPGYTSPEEMGFQQQYEASQTAFQNQIDSIINGYAKTLNKKGQQIHYGVNGSANAEGNVNSDYKNGVTLNYDSEQSNNLEEILCAMTVIMQQGQSDHHKEALELEDALYKSSHTYDYEESSLYRCSSGCETTHYFCNEAKNGYLSTEMKYSPYLYEALYVPDENHECEVDRKTEGMTFDQYAGCQVVGTCYHEDGEYEDGGFGDYRPQESECSNVVAEYDCPGHEEDDGEDEFGNSSSHTEYCSGPLGCEGFYYCGGHNHYGCPDGHDTTTCFGHVDVVMNVHMRSFEELFELGGVAVDENGTANMDQIVNDAVEDLEKEVESNE